MLRLPPFRYLRPRTLAEAADLVAEQRGRAMLVAGGTDLLPNMKRRQFEPELLVALGGIDELRGLEPAEDGGLILGAGLTLAQVSGSRRVRSAYRALAEAASQVANPQIQRMGTLGGNLCVDTRCNYYNQTYEWRRSIGFCLKRDGHVCLVAPGSTKCWAVSSSDTAPALMALGASVVLADAGGRRILPLRELYRDDGIDYLAKRPEEVLARIILPPANGLRSTYRKVRRRGSFDFPILGVAAALAVADGVVREARVVLGAVHTHPVEVGCARDLMVGERPTADLIEAAAEAAYAAATPLDNTDLTLYWRKRVARVTVRRALAELAGFGPER